MPDKKIAALILTAGRSSRMGNLKALLPLAGKTVIETVIGVYRTAGVHDVTVVVGHRASEMIPVLDALGVSWTENAAYDRGMFSSIQAGVKNLKPDTAAFFLQPVDSPLIRPETLRTLIALQTQNRGRIYYPCYVGRRGHPPLIAASLIPEILGYDGEGGLRRLLARFQQEAVQVEIADPGILMNLNTPQEYEQILNTAARGKML